MVSARIVEDDGVNPMAGYDVVPMTVTGKTRPGGPIFNVSGTLEVVIQVLLLRNILTYSA